ncbi:MAG: DUF3089 domain-containing protein [Solirubrobacteraceae bacterium]
MNRVRAFRPFAVVLAIAIAIAANASLAGAKTVWLCKPGSRPDPCTPGLATTVFSPAGRKLRVIHPQAVKHPAIDCFYVYPTVSDQKTTLANFKVDPVERSIALYQVARYSQYCRVFAPMYRQVTIAALASGNRESPSELRVPAGDVHRAFEDYLAHYNHGHGFVLIGHSQGSFVLRRVIARDVDSHPAVRKRLLSAILLGGDVLVKHGSDVAGDFKHIRACHSALQLGCVVAFSTFDTPVIAHSLFGVSADPADSVLCTNPAALGGGAGRVNLIAPSTPFYQRSTLAVGIALLGFTYPKASTTWLSEPGAYRARCSSANHANVLQISALGGSPTPRPSPDGTWGLHLVDANIALGNLIALVQSEAKAFAARSAHL